jgi:type II secretory pathway pseudopilin PulG
MCPASFGEMTSIYRRVSAGFTIIELGVVLAVMTVIASVALPDFIEMARNQLAKNAAAQVIQIQDGARTYFHQSVLTGGVPDAPSNAKWPGEGVANSCVTASAPMQKLIDDGYLSESARLNPWGFTIGTELSPGPAGPLAAVVCAFRVTTDVPTSVAQVVSTYLPGGICDPVACGDVPAPAAGYLRCCTRGPKPGIEVSIAAALAIAANSAYP